MSYLITAKCSQMGTNCCNVVWYVVIAKLLLNMFSFCSLFLSSAPAASWLESACCLSTLLDRVRRLLLPFLSPEPHLGWSRPVLRWILQWTPVRKTRLCTQVTQRHLRSYRAWLILWYWPDMSVCVCVCSAGRRTSSSTIWWTAACQEYQQISGLACMTGDR